MAIRPDPLEFKMSTERKRIYLARRVDDARELSSALESKSYSRIFEIGHRVKGSARLFDFVEFEILAAKLEEAAQKNDATTLFRLIAEFEGQVTKYSSELDGTSTD